MKNNSNVMFLCVVVEGNDCVVVGGNDCVPSSPGMA